MSKKDLIEDIYPLSPMQQGMLFHTLYDATSGVYIQQKICTLQGQLDLTAFKHAWQQVIERHTVLRTAFIWERRDTPFQLVQRRVRLPWEQHDWSHLPPAEQQRQLEAYLQAERTRGFDLSRAPLMRLALIQLFPESYRFIWTHHHMLLDGWSAPLILKEVFAYYTAFSAGQELMLERPRPYGDYIAWLQEQDAPRAEAYWRQMLVGFHAPTPLVIEHDLGRAPGDASAPAGRPAEQQIRLTPTTTAELQARAQRGRLTLSAFVQGAWALLLSRYSGERDIVFGVTVSGRPASLAGIETMVGLFINTLPLRARVRGDMQLLAWLKQLQDQQVELRQYEYSPLVQVQGWSEVPRGLPLFESIVVFENYPVDIPAQPADHVRLTIRDVWGMEETNYPISVGVVMAAVCTLRISYDAQRIEGGAIRRMIGHLRTLLAGMLASPAQRLDDLSLLTSSERQQLLAEWNTTHAISPRDWCIHELFEAQAGRVADSIAVVGAGPGSAVADAASAAEMQLTYRELNARANRLAAYLRRLGVGPDVRVGVCVERSVDLAVGLLGILKAGGAYVPLDPSYPPRRLAYMLTDARLPLLLTQRHLAGVLPSIAATTICLDSHWATIAQEPAATVTSGASGANLAYLIYTSGSTGQPKGVLITHRAMVNHSLAISREYALQAGDRMMHAASLSFDFAVEELFPALVSGATVLFLPEGLLAEIDLLMGWIARMVLTIALLPTAYWNEWVRQLALAAQPLPATLRLVAIGGERALPERLRAWQQLPGLRTTWINTYGPTEATVSAIVYRVAPAEPQRDWTEAPIGRPIANVQAYVLDRDLHPAPVGVPGQLYLGGAGLARGYQGRPDQTADRFIPNPFASGSEIRGQGLGSEPRSLTPAPRLYRTGDLVRYRPTGELEYLGRVDQQVKIHGFRIEPGEIAAALNEHRQVVESVVLVREDVPGNQRLVAYVVTSNQLQVASASDSPLVTPHASLEGDSSLATRHASLTNELREWLRSRLPVYMLPSAFVLLDALPLTPNGKLDRKALPAPDEDSLTRADFVAPRTPHEELLAQIWADVLRLERVGVHDNFFALGGDSILSLQLIARATKAGLRFTPRQLFQHPTIAGLAGVGGVAPAPTIPQGPVIGPAPLTPIQRYFFTRYLPTPQHYNQALLLEVRQPLVPLLLHRTVRRLLAHHDALRMRFIREASDWRQVNAGVEGGPVVEWVDLSALPVLMQGQAIEAAAARLHTSLDLTRGPLVRVAYMDLGVDQPGRLLLIIHHLVVDGVAWRILLEDFQTVYVQLQRQEQAALPPKTTSFNQWAERLRDYAQSDAVRQERAYWLAAERRHAARMPMDYRGGDNTMGSSRSVVVELDAAETRALLHETSEIYHTQINDLLMTALAQAWRAWTGEPTLLLDLEGHGREDLFEDLDLSRTVGWFTTLFPVVLDLRQAHGIGAALKTIKEQLRQIPHRGIGYGILRYLSPDPELVAALEALPAAQLSFNYLGQLDHAVPATGMFGPARESSGPARSAHELRSHLLEINGIVAEGRLRLIWIYGEQLHARARIQRLAQEYLAALRALITHCRSEGAGGYTPSDFPLARMDQSALDRLVGADRRVEALYPLTPMQQGMLFHTLYEAESGVYVEQLVCTIDGGLDLPTFQRAWQHVAQRHAVFRTAFIWEGLREPLQIVRRDIALPWTVEDLRGRSAETRESRLRTFLADDRRRGFALGQAPLMRLALFQVAGGVYRFIWSHHHLLLDGWSAPIVLGEVFKCYGAFSCDQAAQLPSIRPYQDYIAWLQRQDPGAAEAFWRQALAGISATTALGVEQHTRPDAGAACPAERRSVLTPDQTASLQALARQHGLTLNTLAQGAWALLLSRYSRELDVIFGVTVSGRPPELAGVEQMVGLFINTLPLRVRMAPDAPLLTWLRQLQAQLAELRQHEYSSLAQVQSWSDAPPGRALFESVVVFENYPAQIAGAPADMPPRLSIADVRSIEQTNYPLTLGVAPGPPLALTLAYDNRRFDDTTIARMLGHVRTLLAGMAIEPTRRLADAPMLTDVERHQALEEWNVAATSAAPNSTLSHLLFEAQAEYAPDAIAVMFENAHLSYGELNARANQLAHYLLRLGIRPDTLVGVCIERSIDMLVGLLGVLKAGGAYVPLDPAYPLDRLRFMLADSQARALITTDEQNCQLASLSACQLIRLDGDWAAMSRLPGTPPPSGGALGNLAYVIYTSGSLGAPKGVQISHGALGAYIRTAIDRYELTACDRVLQFASISFDASVDEIYPCLVAGATLVLRTEAMIDTPAQFMQRCTAWGLTVLIPPTAYWHEVAALPGDALAVPPTLRLLILGGERAQPERLSAWQAHTRSRVQVLNTYGPTEATVTATAYPVPAWPAAALAAHETPIGRVLATLQAYLLDCSLQPVPIGVAGELYLGGAQLARGYLGRPELTAERFVPNPFTKGAGVRGQGPGARGLGSGVWGLGADPGPQTPNPEPRLYRTGDLARYLPDGAIEFVGRIDEQVKIRGYRVEPGEIEAALAQHPLVRAGVVVAHPGAPGDLQLIAYLVMNNEFDVTSSAGSSLVARHSSLASVLRAFLAERLPEYMIPATFVTIGALPLTPNGKLDRRALPLPDAGRSEASRRLIAPRSPVEELLAQIWADVLHLEQVGVHDNFFELGGHSLLATQVIARVRDAFQVEISLRSLFDAPTIAGLARRLLARQPDVSALQAPPLRRMPRAAAPPLSFAQQRLWFLDQLRPNSSAYSMPLLLHVEGRLDLAALAQSLNAVVARHEILRTTFALTGERPSQVIAPPYSVALPLLDLQDLPATEREPAATRLITAELRRSFDLARGPLLRVTLLRLRADEHALLLNMHHIIVDGWAVELLVREVTALYAAAVQGAPAVLPDLPVQYADYALWQREWLQGEALDAQIAYWRKRLVGLPVLALPTDYPRPPVLSLQGASQNFALTPALSRRLVELSRREGATLFMLLLASFQLLLARYSNQSDIVVGAPIAGRTHAETESLIGLFINTLALRSDLGANRPFQALLRHVREICLEAYAHQDVPFEQVVEALQPVRDLSRHPLFQVLIVLQSGAQSSIALPGLNMRPLSPASTTALFDLAFSFIESEDGLVGSLEYSTELFRAETIKRLLRHFHCLLENIVADPAQRVADMPLMTAAERRQLLVEWNDTAVTYRRDECIHDLLMEPLERQPDAIAVVFGDALLTYHALHRRANQLAHCLCRRGVGPDVRVGLYVERSLELVIGLLGILKAGGAYVPLDPTYPAERIRFMLDDAQLKALLIATSNDRRSTIANQRPETGSRAENIIEYPTSNIQHRQMVDLVADWPIIAQAPATPPPVRADAGNLAYMIYTSGSTGAPKGVQIPHGAVVNFLHAMRRQPGMVRGDALIAITSLSFDIAALELLLPLVTGACLALAARAATLDGAQLAAQIDDAGVTMMQATPTTWQLLLAAGWRGNPAMTMLCGGEALARSLADQLLARGGALWNMYGPTETTIWSASSRVAAQAGAAPLGRPIANTQFYVLDRHLQPVPLGAAGELYIGGDGLARGYLGRPDLTADRFVPNLFGEESGVRSQESEDEGRPMPSGRPDERRTTNVGVAPIQNPKYNIQNGSRLYKTGDRVRYRTDGALEFLGRLDDQVKLRGFRVELGEVAAALRQHPAVQDAVVVAREEAPGAMRLVAYVVQDSGARGQESGDMAQDPLIPDPRSRIPELRAFLAAHLPAYMLPAAFVTLPALPRTPNGKIDRRALPAPDSARPALDDAMLAPRTPVEEVLAILWAETLDLDQIGVHDNFFDLGGHSLLATQVVSRICEALQIELPLLSLFELPTVAKLAALILQDQGQRKRIERRAQLLVSLAEFSEDEVEGLLEEQTVLQGKARTL